MNLGGLLLQALLEYWPRTHVNPMDEEENEVNHGSCFCIRIIDLKLLRSLGYLECLLFQECLRNFKKHLLSHNIINNSGCA